MRRGTGTSAAGGIAGLPISLTAHSAVDLDVGGHVGFDLIGVEPFVQVLAQTLRRGGVDQFAAGPLVDQRADDAPLAVDHGAIEGRFQDAPPRSSLRKLGRCRRPHSSAGTYVR